MAPQVSPGLPPVAITPPTRTTANRVAQASRSFPTRSQHGKHETGLHAIQAKAILPLHNIVRSNSETENNPEQYSHSSSVIPCRTLLCAFQEFQECSNLGSQAKEATYSITYNANASCNSAVPPIKSAWRCCLCLPFELEDCHKCATLKVISGDQERTSCTSAHAP